MIYFNMLITFPASYKGVQSQVVIKAEHRHCALYVGPCCVLRVTAVKLNWKEKMLVLVQHIRLPVALEWEFFSGKMLHYCKKREDDIIPLNAFCNALISSLPAIEKLQDCSGGMQISQPFCLGWTSTLQELSELNRIVDERIQELFWLGLYLVMFLFQGTGVSSAVPSWKNKGLLLCSSLPWWLWRDRSRTQVVFSPFYH